MFVHVVGAVIAALILLGGLYTILRNFTLFLVDSLRGHPGVPWFNRPYLFRALGVLALILWLYGPYSGVNNTLQLTGEEQRLTAFALYVIAAANGLWTLRISFLTSIPPALLPYRTHQRGRISWRDLATVSYLLQLVLAAAIGSLFAFFPDGIQAILARIGVLALLLGSAFVSLWRTSYITAVGPEHSFAERLQHVVGGPDAGPPHTPPASGA
jgi:hypothetical protein